MMKRHFLKIIIMLVDGDFSKENGWLHIFVAKQMGCIPNFCIAAGNMG